VLLAFEKARERLPDGPVYTVTGNPVRPDVIIASREKARRKLGIAEGKSCILSFGGSLGAQRINETVAELIAWHNGSGRVHHIHATGKYAKELMPRLLREKGVKFEDNPDLDIREYINDMPDCLAAADIVISRAGAITLSEIEASGKASILIPSPNVAENHQYHNAMVLAQRQAAIVIEEKELTGERLIEETKKLLGDPVRLLMLGQNASAGAKIHAAEQIADEILELVK